MNNEQFRRLLLANAAKAGTDKARNGGTSPPSGARPAGSSTPSGGSLGSKLRSSIPMTPRSVAGAGGNARNDFARQMAERNQVASDKTQKKLRTSAPKGSRLAQGYVDRSKTREEQEEEDDRAARLKALEESLKKEEIDQATYDRLRGEIAGGDLSSTHLVKGLDFKLLERAEAVPQEKDSEAAIEPEEDVDDVLDQLETAEVKAVTKEKIQKKGQFAPTAALNPGVKRSRNQILAELKAAREAAKAKEESSLGSKFKKIGAKKTPGTRIERDSKGREVMIIVDEDGHERRKVRKVDPKVTLEEQEKEQAALAQAPVLGMEVPEFYKQKLAEQQQLEAAEEEDKEMNIFDDVGSDYDPLAGLEGGSDDDDSSSDEEGAKKEDKLAASGAKEEAKKAPSTDMPPPPLPKPNAVPASGARNYFKDAKVALTSEETYKKPSLDDPSFLAALKKAKAASAAEKSEEEQKTAEREARLRKKLQESNRDDEDLDFGFGSSRAEDLADGEEETKVKLSEWGRHGEEDDDDEGGGGGGGDEGKSKRKRGSKKRKGDKNSFSDVMRVIEHNKSGG
ncbi:hypothetical protein B0T17DRAFT_536944 [Bombardia bombarda]|uniref:RED-like N-terminal domain-containing protein n=1 Tax=Bombardia bombarda TaxID=252184 RepID=A0AA40BY97_9PEZI|nr:hypothetical protein B0T17DRAFT_536944 [Bombardia bombarda]